MNFKTMITSFFIGFLLVMGNAPTTTAVEDCQNAVTCKECLHESRRSHCAWAGDWQKCLGRGGGHNNSITISREKDCPVAAAVYEGRDSYRVYVDNDLFGLLRYMEHVGVSCSRRDRAKGYAASVTIKGGSCGEVLCFFGGAQADYRDGGGPFSLAIGPANVAWNVKELSEVWFDPEFAWWNAGTVLLTVTVPNSYAVQSHFAMVAVTVAGRPCNFVYRSVNRTQPGQNLDRRWCEVSFKDPRAVQSSSPVIVRFGAGASASRKTNFEVRSARHFDVLAPQLRAVDGPSCGPKSGGTLLTVLGSSLDVPNKRLKMNLTMSDGSTECEVLKTDERRLTCRTIPFRSASTPARLDVFWDDDMELQAPDFRFSYAEDPAPIFNQRLNSIASGGTKIKVAWNSLACVTVDEVKFYVRVVGEGGSRYREYTQCRVAADNSSTECTVPAVALSNDTVSAKFDCGFELEFAGGRLDYWCDQSNIEYVVNVDPRFSSFELQNDGQLIVIYGSGLFSGFGVEDVTVVQQFSKVAHDACDVQLVADGRIECKPNSVTLVKTIDNSWKSIIVTVGNAPPVVVPHL